VSSKNLVVKLVAESTENVVLQVPRALVASALAAALDFGVLVLLVERGGWNAALAAVVGYLLGGVVQYVLCAWWVFPAQPQSVSMGFAAFTVLSLVGLVITWATMAGLHDLGHVNYAVSKVVALGLAFAWNFLSRKYLLFKPAVAECVSERGPRLAA
jgi:putative flippase GtrA